MSQAEWFTTYLEYETLKDMLSGYTLYVTIFYDYNAILLYHITYQKKILFIHTGIVGGIVAHYHIIEEKPRKKFIELNKMTGNFTFVDSMVAILNLSTFYCKIGKIHSCISNR
jgi:hypothetical protein